jgi:hypothetical protein
MCVLISLQLMSETFLTVSRIQRDIITNVQKSSSKLPIILSDFDETQILLTDFQKILKYQISQKSVQWKQSCSMQMDRQKDRHDEANSHFSQFCKCTWEVIYYISETDATKYIYPTCVNIYPKTFFGTWT